MKDLITKLQKDLLKFHDSVQQERHELTEKVKSMLDKGHLEGKGRELEKLIETKLKGFEPAFDRLVKELTKNAKKTGIDLSKFEKEIQAAKEALKKKVSKKTSKKKKVSKKKATKKKATEKKETKKKETKKKTTKKKATKKKLSKKKA